MNDATDSARPPDAPAGAGDTTTAPLIAIPLEYAAADLTPPRTAMLKVLTLLGWASIAMTPIVMKTVSTEVIVLTGSALAVCGAAMLVLGVFLVIYWRNWSPRFARDPVLAISIVFALLTAIATWRVFAHRRAA